MINIKYKNVYDEFIKRYEEIHVNPWHEIGKEELDNIYSELINNMNIDNEYNFKYLMDHIIKRLSGKDDAHTKYFKITFIPMNFRIFNNDVLINYPDDLKGSKLLSINNISVEQVINELEEVVTYGTEGKRIYELEKSLFNKAILFGLPSFRNSEELEYKIEDKNGNTIIKKFKKIENYDNLFNYNKYRYGDNTKYYFKDNCLIYNHSSVQPKFKEQIEKSIKLLEQENISDIDTIIVDIRGNTGGNAALNKMLIDYLLKHKDKKLICLTDYRVFSGGRYALRDLIEVGATTIGGEISTPINCYGNSNWFMIDDYEFSVSECYFHPSMGWSASSKEEYNSEVTDELMKPYIFKPDICVLESEEDYINGIDTVLEYALEYSKNKIKK